MGEVIKHTAGPWEAAKPSDYGTDGIGVFARNPAGMRYYIANVRYMGTADVRYAEANARAIAAVPELINALCSISLSERDTTSNAAEKVKDMARIARTALAKL
jgi:hypothetical protein